MPDRLDSRTAAQQEKHIAGPCCTNAAGKKKPVSRTGFCVSCLTAYLRWPLISLVISNIDTWAFLKISFNLASALIIVRLAESCRLFFLM